MHRGGEILTGPNVSQEGRPIYIEQLGRLDLTKLYAVTTPERQMQSLVVEYERFQRDRLPICSDLQGHLIETSCTIMDLNNVGMSQFWKVKNYVQEASGSECTSILSIESILTAPSPLVSQNNYPESVRLTPTSPVSHTDDHDCRWASST